MEQFDKKTFIIGSIITFIVCLLLSAGIFGFMCYYNASLDMPITYEIWEHVIDSLMISGFFGLIIYSFSFLSGKGAFDIISYSVQLVWYNTFHRSVRETALPKTYAEYKQIKRGQPVSSTLFLLVGSLPTFLSGLIIMIPYYIIIR